MNTHRKINLDHTQQSSVTWKDFDDLYAECKHIFSLHQGDIGNAKLFTTDINTGDHLPTAQRLYTLPLKHTQWVQEELEMLEKSGILS